MGMTMIEKILAHHSVYDVVRAGEIVDVNIDLRVSRDLGGASIIKQLNANNQQIADPNKTFFTFDAYSSENEEAAFESQQVCRLFAKDNGVRIFDKHSGIGTHLLIDQGFATPGSVMVSSDSHANILGAIGALGYSLKEKDLAQAFTKGKMWYRVPKSIKINCKDALPKELSAKDIALNLLSIFGTNKLLGYAVELGGPAIDMLSLDGRISLASMANEIGAATFLMAPNQEVIDYCLYKSNRNYAIHLPDEDAEYEEILNINVSKFTRMVSRPSTNFDIVPVEKLKSTGIDSAFIGTCTNGRIEDLRVVAGILKSRKVAPGIVLKIVPATDEIWTLALQEGLIDIFKESGAIVSNAGCDGCSSGQSVNTLGQVTISSGNSNFQRKTGKGDIYISSPAIVAASAIAGYITTPEAIPERPNALFSFPDKKTNQKEIEPSLESTKPKILEGKTWSIPFDNIDTDMIYHTRYTEISDLSEYGNYAFSELKGYEHFAKEALPGDIVVVGHNFGLGNSSQHAVDCFKSLGIQAIIAKSFAVLYEKNAINAGLPIIVCSATDQLDIQTGDVISINLLSGEITNTRNNRMVVGEKFSGIQLETFQQENH
ncbi:MAG TPA: aconitase family protein [Bacteroidales bacterium]|nr:aconitase family protein [Bacteroidales bacterium]